MHTGRVDDPAACDVTLSRFLTRQAVVSTVEADIATLHETAARVVDTLP